MQNPVALLSKAVRLFLEGRVHFGGDQDGRPPPGATFHSAERKEPR